MLSWSDYWSIWVKKWTWLVLEEKFYVQTLHFSYQTHQLFGSLWNFKIIEGGRKVGNADWEMIWNWIMKVLIKKKKNNERQKDFLRLVDIFWR